MSRVNELEPSTEVHGCLSCGFIFTVSSYIEVGCAEAYCPSCRIPAPKKLGMLPSVVEDAEKQFYLMGTDGLATGPYASLSEAQNSLWDWFKEKDKQDEQKAKCAGGQVVNLHKVRSKEAEDKES